MIARRISALAMLIAVVVVVVIVADSGSSGYMVKMRLADASGLRQGAPVAIGGQDVGQISMNVVHGSVLVTMTLDSGVGPVGKNASASVASVNLLGQKRVELDKGNVADPAKSGYTLPGSQVTVTPDLDQVLNVLTPDVRARLAILINEAGQAFTGRKADFSRTLQELPADLTAGTELVNGVSDDNHTLAALVQHSDAFVTQIAAQRSQLVHLVKVLGQASATVQAKRAQLAATLEQAPSTLVSLQSFLGKLQTATVPLGPAANDITHTAPALQGTLAQLDPFRQAADPTLQEATKVAPELTALANGATPVVRQATPVVAQLATFTRALAPISTILNGSADNLVAILQNWSRAIQFRDGLSHVFRGEASFTPQDLTSLLNQLEASGTSTSTPARGPATTTRTPAVRRPSAATNPATPKPASTPASGTSSGSTSTPAGSATPGSTTSTTSTSPTSSGSTGSGSGGGLGSLLQYLLGR